MEENFQFCQDLLDFSNTIRSIRSEFDNIISNMSKKIDSSSNNLTKLDDFIMKIDIHLEFTRTKINEAAKALVISLQKKTNKTYEVVTKLENASKKLDQSLQKQDYKKMNNISLIKLLNHHKENVTFKTKLEINLETIGKKVSLIESNYNISSNTISSKKIDTVAKEFEDIEKKLNLVNVSYLFVKDLLENSKNASVVSINNIKNYSKDQILIKLDDVNTKFKDISNKHKDSQNKINEANKIVNDLGDEKSKSIDSFNTIKNYRDTLITYLGKIDIYEQEINEIHEQILGILNSSDILVELEEELTNDLKNIENIKLNIDNIQKDISGYTITLKSNISKILGNVTNIIQDEVKEFLSVTKDILKNLLQKYEIDKKIPIETEKSLSNTFSNHKEIDELRLNVITNKKKIVLNENIVKNKLNRINSLIGDVTTITNISIIQDQNLNEIDELKNAIQENKKEILELEKKICGRC